ncbi:hypothetical protein D3C83_278940 [compost metagenome]
MYDREFPRVEERYEVLYLGVEPYFTGLSARQVERPDPLRVLRRDPQPLGLRIE